MCEIKFSIGWEIDIGLLKLAREAASNDSNFKQFCSFEFMDCMAPSTFELLLKMCTDGKVTLIYIFMIPEAMRRLEKTLVKCLQSNSSLRVVTRTSHIDKDLLSAIKQDSELNLY